MEVTENKDSVRLMELTFGISTVACLSLEYVFWIFTLYLLMNEAIDFINAADKFYCVNL